MTSLPPEWSDLPKNGALLLLRAYTFARNLSRPASDFAIEIHRLRQEGFDECQLRRRLCEQLIDHYYEGRVPNRQGTTLVPVETLRFTPASCFALTDKGAEYVRKVLNDATNLDGRWQAGTTPSLGAKKRIPHWNAETQTLSVGKFIVKHFRLPAPVQKQALDAFEQSKWVTRIDDPLSPHVGDDSKSRLRGLIESLNRNQQTPLIHFYGDGQGTGICWRVVRKRSKRRK